MPYTPRHLKPVYVPDQTVSAAIVAELTGLTPPKTAGEIRSAIGVEHGVFYPALDALTADGVLVSQFHERPGQHWRTYALATPVLAEAA